MIGAPVLHIPADLLIPFSQYLFSIFSPLYNQTGRVRDYYKKPKVFLLQPSTFPNRSANPIREGVFIQLLTDWKVQRHDLVFLILIRISCFV